MLLGVVGKQARASFLSVSYKELWPAQRFSALNCELILGVTIGDGKKNITCKLYDFTEPGTDVMEYRFGA